MSNERYFPARMAGLMARYHKGMEEDNYMSRVYAALDELEFALKQLEERVGVKILSGDRGREERLRRHRARTIEKGRKAAKRARKLEEKEYHDARDFQMSRSRPPSEDQKSRLRIGFESEAKALSEVLALRRLERDAEKVQAAILSEPPVKNDGDGVSS